jgi:hypothetical protein
MSATSRLPVTIELTKRLVRDLTHRDLDRQLQNEAWAIGIQTEDRAEGGQAFGAGPALDGA